MHAAVYQHHLAAREAQFGIGAKFTTAGGNSWIDDLIRKQAWGITMIHGITKNFDALTSPDVLDQHFKYVKSLDTQLWVTTYVNIIKYIAERDSTTIHVDYKPNHLICTLSNHLNTRVYNQPLTLAVNCGQAVTKFKVMQAGKILPVYTKGDMILVNISPVKGTVDMRWQKQ